MSEDKNQRKAKSVVLYYGLVLLMFVLFYGGPYLLFFSGFEVDKLLKEHLNMVVTVSSILLLVSSIILTVRLNRKKYYGLSTLMITFIVAPSILVLLLWGSCMVGVIPAFNPQ